MNDDRRQALRMTLAAAGLAVAPASSLFAFEASSGKLPQRDAASGIRAALEQGAAYAVDALGREGGFLDNPLVRITLPAGLERAAQALRMLGQGARLDELVTAMNRAAEAAVPQARTMLQQAARQVTLKDALGIVQGGSTSVTDYFATKTRAPLATKFLPIVTRETERVSLASRYNEIAAKAASFGLVKGDEANVQHYVTAKALDGLYRMIGEKEKAIRADPIGTGSAILQRVFGR